MAYHRRPRLSALRRQSSRQRAIDTFPLFCVAHGLPKPETEVEFAPPRKYRADYCWPLHKVIVERNGAIWKLGGHSSGTGLLRDYEKLNLAQVEGWRYLVFTPDQLCSEIAIETLKQVLG